MTTNHKTLLSRYISRTWEHLWSYRWHSSDDYICGPYCSRSWILYVCVPKRGFCVSANVSYGYHVFWKLVFPKLLSYVLRTNILASWQSNKGLGSKSFMICKYTSLKVFNFTIYTYKLTISCLSQQWNLIYFILISLFHKTIFPPAFFYYCKFPDYFGL